MEKLNAMPVRYLKGIGPKREKQFNAAGVFSVEDLLYYFPRRYEDRTNFSRISQLEEGKVYTLKAKVMARGGRNSFRRRKFSIVEIAVQDETGVLFCVWFNQPYLGDYFQVGQDLVLYGKVERYAGRLQMSSPEFETLLSQEDLAGSLSMGRIVPVYPLLEGVNQRALRRSIKQALQEYLPKAGDIDILPYDIRSRHNLLNLAKSLNNIHFPESFSMQQEAYTRLSFEEFFLFLLPLALRKIKRREEAGIAHEAHGPLADTFLAGLPFSLTASQEEVIGEIRLDMASPRLMQRLLEGDVGSGKTVVATVASLIAIQGGYQVAFMAPTEILARQHYEKIKSQVASSRLLNAKVQIRLLTGSIDKEERGSLVKDIKRGKINLVIGTHALLQEKVVFKNLGLVVIDEQHKFGVGQRALLPGKGAHPDALIMTATPIPRTLAITLYGDLDVSVIKELPPGRKAVKTQRFTEDGSAGAYAIARNELRAGRQVYIVYPVIEESYALDMAGARKMYELFKDREFREFRVGLIHGKLKQAQQDAVMEKFKGRHLDVLVSTTILEVGIDIPNATCMIIQHAERFGLSQLHQLRGRVGRGAAESFCLLISDAGTREAEQRLEAMMRYSDGFRIAEEDLKIRGPGEFFGKRQHGLSELRIANPLTQMQLLKHAREEAVCLIGKDPSLSRRQNMALKEKLLQRFPEYKEYASTG